MASRLTTRRIATRAGLAAALLLALVAAWMGVAFATQMTITSARLGAYGGACTQSTPAPPLLPQPYTIPCF